MQLSFGSVEPHSPVRHMKTQLLKISEDEVSQLLPSNTNEILSPGVRSIH